ncbi:MAG: histidine kinase osmosensor [Geoglossum simile]|nr:MAG: histidine kinase osmosensor [Geoglossum simile]
MPNEAAIAATTAILHNLAKGATASYAFPDPSSTNATHNGTESLKLILPGEDSVAKKALERELYALVSRVKYLEAKASTVNNQALPETPNENGVSASPFDSGTPKSRDVSVRPPAAANDRGANLVSSILASRAGNRSERAQLQDLNEDDLAFLMQHVKNQAEFLDSHKKKLNTVEEEMQEQRLKVKLAETEAERVAGLERELKKNQQANEAFQKALREIGGIVTAVAKGDLSKKVQIHSKEMDPEITTFKRTINTMMDQLQVFASEVSRVAREVGTEGQLGGQAQITGVDGTWKELTDNGMLITSDIQPKEI